MGPIFIIIFHWGTLKLQIGKFSFQKLIGKLIWGQSYKANFGINYIKNGLSKLNVTLNYINFDVIYVTDESSDFGIEECLALNCNLKYCRISHEIKHRFLLS